VKKESGQVLVVFLIFIPPLIVLLFSTVRIACAARERIRLQTGADAAALSAAEWEARGMNMSAEINLALAATGLLKQYVRASSSFSGPVKEARLAMIEAEERSFSSVRQEILEAIPVYAEEAVQREDLFAEFSGPVGPENRITSVAIAGKGHAFASARVFSEYQALTPYPLVPDFTAGLCPVELDEEMLDYLRERAGRMFTVRSAEEINDEILH
jgi:hypothetical protein